MKLSISGVRLEKKSFQDDFKKLPADVKKEASDRIKSLVENPQAGKLRCHPLNGFHPTIYSIDVAARMRYKATFRIEGDIAVFQRIGTHKQIDRCPE